MPQSIEATLDQEATPKTTTEPAKMSDEAAKNMSAFYSTRCPHYMLVQSAVPAHDAAANAANLQTLESQLRVVRNSIRHLAERADFNTNLAYTMSCDRDASIGKTADRFARANGIMMCMPAIYVRYHCACKKYDEAHRMTAAKADSAKVAAVIEMGLVEVDTAMCAVKTALANVHETYMPATSVDAKE
jgi:hypothetical protein